MTAPVDEAAVEAVARAICLALGRDPDRPVTKRVRGKVTYGPPGWRDFVVHAKAAPSLQESSSPRWRPVSEPPQEAGPYLVCGQWEEDGSWWRTVGNWQGSWFFGDWDSNNEPSHWMPFPPPPAPEEPES